VDRTGSAHSIALQKARGRIHFQIDPTNKAHQLLLTIGKIYEQKIVNAYSTVGQRKALQALQQWGIAKFKMRFIVVEKFLNQGHSTIYHHKNYPHLQSIPGQPSP